MLAESLEEDVGEMLAQEDVQMQVSSCNRRRRMRSIWSIIWMHGHGALEGLSCTRQGTD